MEERKLDGLHGLQEEITIEFPQLDCHLDSNQDVFLKVTSKSSVSHGLRYLPNFHVIFTHLEVKKFGLRLITYHGRSLDSFVFECQEKEGNILLPENVSAVLKYVAGGTKLCEGINISRCCNSRNGDFLGHSKCVNSLR